MSALARPTLRARNFTTPTRSPTPQAALTGCVPTTSTRPDLSAEPRTPEKAEDPLHIRLIHSAAAKAALIAAASLALVAAGTAAFAGTHHAPKAAAASSPITVCVGSAKTYSPTRVVFNLHTDGTTTCPSGSFATSWNKAGPQGIQGPPGPAASDVDGSLGGSWSLAAP